MQNGLSALLQIEEKCSIALIAAEYQ